MTPYTKTPANRNTPKGRGFFFILYRCVFVLAFCQSLQQSFQLFLNGLWNIPAKQFLAAAAFAAGAPGFQRTHVVADSGHSVQGDQPAALVEILRGVLGG